MDPDNMSSDDKKDVRNAGRKRMMTMHFLMGPDCDRCGTAIDDFKYAYLVDKNNPYPKTLHDAYTLLKGLKKGGKKIQPNHVGMSFNTMGGPNEDGTILATGENSQYSGPPCN